jgi:hypothetical protein
MTNSMSTVNKDLCLSPVAAVISPADGDGSFHVSSDGSVCDEIGDSRKH